MRFHPAAIGRNPEGAPIEAELLNGRRVRVREGFSSEELRRVLEVVDQAASDPGTCRRR